MTETLDPLRRFRSEFPILETTTYLISNSLGREMRSWERWKEHSSLVT